MTTDDVAGLAMEVGLPDIAAQLADLAEWAIRLERMERRRAGSVPRSRLGGLPELPPSTAWPRARPPFSQAELPMVFIAQIALEDVRSFPQWPGPEEGLLSFFVAGDGDLLYVEDPGGARVIYTSGIETAEPASPPADMAGPVLGDVPLLARDELTLPAFDVHPPGVLLPLGFELDAAPGSAQERREDRYLELVDRLEREQAAREPRHRLLGHPGPVTQDVLAQAADTGLRARLNRFPSEQERRDEAPRWRLLLQIDDQEPGLGITWGHGGTGYFCIPQDDLAAGRYDRVEAVVQST